MFLPVTEFCVKNAVLDEANCLGVADFSGLGGIDPSWLFCANMAALAWTVFLGAGELTCELV